MVALKSSGKIHVLTSIMEGGGYAPTANKTGIVGTVMKFENALEPDQAQIEKFLADDGDAPVHMLNLLKFREFAKYRDGVDAQMSGQEAYMRYAGKMIALVEAAGGSVQFNGSVSLLMIGSMDEVWDAAAIVTYPSAAKMIEITMSPQFQEISKHRKAGLQGQILLKCNASMRD